ncbi:iron ABC transporter permease [Bacillus sp. CLL-7-23]|uniref:Iron ABC transporter permease n=1 Tax=Bacillus changyiensis TaxID=3004103 RepID=A0ABT4X5A5_9BACI|nr:iron ABC transporter permease [Bacillus changyiensis]MDA7027451.1 iron ABC transporter permease [Bacillus changyiensis]
MSFLEVDEIYNENEADHQQHIVSRPLGAMIVLGGGLLLLLVGAALSIILGAADLKLGTVWDALFHFNSQNTAHQIIQELRIPRTISAMLVGACLAVSGAIMQGMTRNALASPEILSVTHGSAFAIAIAFAFFPGISSLGLMFWSFAGAGFGALVVFAIGLFSQGGLTPVKLALAGIAVGTMLSALSSSIAIHFDVARDVSFWYAGGIAGVKWSSIQLLLPAVVLGLVLVLVIARSITILSLGEELAKGLGQYTTAVKVIGIGAVVLLTGAAVSVAGAIGFIGLIIPHITRFLVGIDYRWIIPCSAVLGAVLLIYADIVARLLNPPFETPVGAVTALVGVPFFLYLARHDKRGL